MKSRNVLRGCSQMFSYIHPAPVVTYHQSTLKNCLIWSFINNLTIKTVSLANRNFTRYCMPEGTILLHLHFLLVKYECNSVIILS